ERERVISKEGWLYSGRGFGGIGGASNESSRNGLEDEVVPKVEDVSLVDGVFDGALGGDRDEDFAIGEGGLDDEACVEAIEEEKEEEKYDEDDERSEEDNYLIKMRWINLDVIENESYLIPEIIDNNLGGSIAGIGRGSLAKRSMESNDGLVAGGFVVFTASGEECLDGWVGADGGEVKGGGVDFEVSKILLGEIPGEIIRESGGEVFWVDGGAV
ncbi:hypothetical protein Tco_1233972, partial [Tanacetum coccineum]